MHEQIKTDYAMELQNQKEIMVEKTAKQQELIESQAEELRAMKHRITKLKTVSLDTQDSVKETFDELEEKYYEAERRCQDFEMKVYLNIQSNLYEVSSFLFFLR